MNSKQLEKLLDFLGEDIKLIYTEGTKTTKSNQGQCNELTYDLYDTLLIKPDEILIIKRPGGDKQLISSEKFLLMSRIFDW